LTHSLSAPDDRLFGDVVLPPDVRLTDFWRWAFSDLSEDYLKGFFAEWMVAVLLGLPVKDRPRLEFLRYDHATVAKRIEVKSTARWQSWKVLDEEGRRRPIPKRGATPDAKIRFAGLRTDDGRYNADIYVFCFQHEEDLARWNALDLSQWEFYVLRKPDLQRLGTKSISLKTLRGLSLRLTARDVQKALADGA